MKLTRSDYWLARFCYRLPGLLTYLSSIENQWLASEAIEKPIDRPIYITGLARSGSTILLELISKIQRIGTHRYCDFPFVATPWLWDKYRQRTYTTQTLTPLERPHRDKIQITPLSPESMEEPIWQSWFPAIHSTETVHTIPESTNNKRFARFYRQHINKIILIRQAERYAAKNNYHLTRIEYLLRLFPDARFIIPIRHPITHIASLLRQHELFSQYAMEDSRVGPYLIAAGHYEFGPQRVPIHVCQSSIDPIRSALKNQQDHIAYAIQWRDIYAKPLSLLIEKPDLVNQVTLVKHEDFCRDPYATWNRIALVCELDPVQQDFKHIVAPESSTGLTDKQKTEIWDVTCDIAESIGYYNDPTKETMRSN